MTGHLTDYGENLAVDAVTGEGVASGSRWLALFTADPGEAGSMANELANSNGYGRQSVSGSGASSGADDNATAVTFTASGGDWSEATHVGLVDSGTHGAGNVIAVKELSTAVTVTNGTSFQFDAGDFNLQGTGELTTYGKNLVVDAVFGAGVSSFTPHVGLASADPGASGSFTNELANSNGYSRQSFAVAGASSGGDDNDAAITFTASGGDWTAATHHFVADSGTHGAGNMIATAALSSSQVVADGGSLEWDAGGYDILGD